MTSLYSCLYTKAPFQLPAASCRVVMGMQGAIHTNSAALQHGDFDRALHTSEAHACASSQIQGNVCASYAHLHIDEA